MLNEYPVPHFILRDFPAEERRAISDVEAALSWLWSNLIHYNAAIELIAESRARHDGVASYGDAEQALSEKRAITQKDRHELYRRLELEKALYDGWVKVAVRSAAISLNGARLAMDRAQQWRDCPTFKSLIDGAGARAARRTFREIFPHARAIRDCVAHPGELFGSDVERGKHALIEEVEKGRAFRVRKGGFVDGLYEYHIDNVEFTSTFHGKIVSQEFSYRSAERLENCIRKFLFSFRGADIFV